MTDLPVDHISFLAQDPLPTLRDPSWITWVVRVTATGGILVVAWACLTGWGAIVHGYPLYAVLLLATVLGSAFTGSRTVRRRPRRGGWRRVTRIVLILVSIGWIGLMAWLRPFTAAEPALAAMMSDAKVAVAESATQIVMTPTGSASHTGVFFQPGAKVDARAYAAVLRPLAESGYTVIIPKQPLGIAFLSIFTFDATKPAYPAITRWVLGGHSLGGSVAAMQADSADNDSTAPVVGLFLCASYPITDFVLVSDQRRTRHAGQDRGLQANTAGWIDVHRDRWVRARLLRRLRTATRRRNSCDQPRRRTHSDLPRHRQLRQQPQHGPPP